ncbi:hypothetical protein APHAL10511_000684 [Amanita phalloides]|nr:hypothetical protein APHAL10511_000684 [Amanita phalloides]
MSTFARSSFNASIYASARPTYPRKLFKRILAYHKRSPDAKYDLALDLGCGTGQATRHLVHFHRILAIDTSETMLSAARPLFATSPWSDKVTFAQGHAEDLRAIGVEDASVDLMISAQAAHWFDWTKAWPETRRVLRKGGCAAFFIYSEFKLSAYPSVNEVITRYAQGKDPATSLGPHFERPGRTILENHLLDVPHPSTILIPSPSSPPSIMDPTGCGLGDVERVFFAGLTPPPSLNLPPTTRPVRLGHALADAEHPPTASVPLTKVEHNPIVLTKTMTWLELLAYIRSWSALHNFSRAYPEDKATAADERFLKEDIDLLDVNDRAVQELHLDEGDIAVRFWKDLREGASNTGGASGVLDKVEVEWPVAMLLVRRT